MSRNLDYLMTTVLEIEVVKKQYTKILDAYGCLGVLQLYSGESTLLYLVMFVKTTLGRQHG
ncbi:hypothetical protein D910_02645 [Dendroctonus ponderosae]|uniref:Uncharacterized protein n=1 Tax=Dendroctonus ponderosae TaxID=77166 RepID=U4TUI7_DENPD|nr:hypothetical protein D910_02645 [Dendroctonus ponderosae]